MLRGTSSSRVNFGSSHSHSGAAHAARSFHDTAPSIPSPYPRSEGYVDPKRKHTILSLLDVLSELSNDPPTDNGQLSPAGHLHN